MTHLRALARLYNVCIVSRNFPENPKDLVPLLSLFVFEEPKVQRIPDLPWLSGGARVQEVECGTPESSLLQERSAQFKPTRRA